MARDDMDLYDEDLFEDDEFFEDDPLEGVDHEVRDFVDHELRAEIDDLYRQFGIEPGSSAEWGSFEEVDPDIAAATSLKIEQAEAAAGVGLSDEDFDRVGRLSAKLGGDVDTAFQLVTEQLPLPSLRPGRGGCERELVEAGETPLPEKLTPHSMRRTFASILYAIREDPGVVMDEMGHTDPGLALRIYRQSMRRDEGEREAAPRPDRRCAARNGRKGRNEPDPAPGVPVAEWAHNEERQW